MNADIAKHILGHLKATGVVIEPGLNDQEIEQVRVTTGIVLPPDLAMLLRQGLPVGELFPDWRHNAAAVAKDSHEHIVEGIIFDAAESDYWHPLFGDRPEGYKLRRQRISEVVAKLPPLVLIHGKAFLPSDPWQAGNPVLSVWQAVDTVFLGADIVDYFIRAMGISIDYPAPDHINKVPYWGDIFDLNGVERLEPRLF